MTALKVKAYTDFSEVDWKFHLDSQIQDGRVGYENHICDLTDLWRTERWQLYEDYVAIIKRHYAHDQAMAMVASSSFYDTHKIVNARGFKYVR